MLPPGGHHKACLNQIFTFTFFCFFFVMIQIQLHTYIFLLHAELNTDSGIGPMYLLILNTSVPIE